MFASDSTRLASADVRPAPTVEVREDDPLLRAVGATPLVPLRALVRREKVPFELWGKLESRNPSGSVKDRAALAIVRTAIADGSLAGGRTLVDASSGNTGLAYAMLGARLGFPVRLFVPRNAKPSRLAAIRALGAEVVLTDAAEGTDGAQRAASTFVDAAKDRYFLADQYSNPANPDAHYRGTGPELWQQSRGRLTHLVAGVGTGGTITGTGRALKERGRGIRVVAVEPTGPLHGLEGLKHLPTARRPSTYDPSVPDETERVETEEALTVVQRLAHEEGLLVGPSSGAAVAAALRVGRRSPGAFVVAILPDGGEPGGM